MGSLVHHPSGKNGASEIRLFLYFRFSKTFEGLASQRFLAASQRFSIGNLHFYRGIFIKKLFNKTRSLISGLTLIRECVWEI